MSSIIKEEFYCYRSGILTSIATFAGDKILNTERSYYTNEFGELKAVQDNNLYSPTVYKLWKLSGNREIWTGDIVNLGEYVYEKYLTVQDEKLGEGYVYAQMLSNASVDVVTYKNQLVGFMIPGRNESVTIVKNGYQNLTNQALWESKNISQDEYTIEDLGTFMVPMRDGIKLATSVAVPHENNGRKLPAILVRTCYNKNENKMMWDKYAKRGYAVVVQDTRGREASEGEWIPFGNEINDGDDTLNWIAGQSWSNGSVGMLGGSYLGFVQWAAAASGNKHLKALVSQVTAGSPFVDLPRRGGTFGSGILAWSFMVAKKETNFAACIRDDWEKLLSHRPISEIPQLALRERIPFYDKWMEHQDNDSFWQSSDWSLHGDKIDVPALYVSGWFDDDGPGTTLAWEMNSKNNRLNQRMILGPWLHKANSSRKIHNFKLDKNVLRYDLDCLYVRWFDRFLKGISNSVETEQSVEYYMLGDNTWRRSKQWPPENAELTKMFLSSKKSAQSSLGDGKLCFEQQKELTSSEYIFDPYNPFPYLIDMSENECAVPEDYSSYEARVDVLIYTSPELSEEIAIAGDVFAEVYAASSCIDTDWVVRLTDVGTDGSSLKLSDGIIRARYRNSYEKPELLVPGKVEKYYVRMTRIAHTFKKGHKIRLQITSGADRLCFANSNTGGCESQAVTLIKAEQRVYHGGEYTSCILLPIIK